MYLTQFLHRAATQYPNLTCSIDAERRRTWGDSVERIARSASVLNRLGVRDGDRVAVLAHNSDYLHEMLLSIAWADAVFVPVHTRWSMGEIVHALNDSGAELLVVDNAFADRVTSLREQCPQLRVVLHAGIGLPPQDCEGLDDLLAKCEPAPDRRRGGDAACGIFYTGGTTGHPKGVVLTHTNLIVSALGTAASDGFVIPGGRTLLVAPMFHVAGFSMWLSRNVLGGSHVFLPTFDPQSVAHVIERYRITDTLLVPSMIRLLLDSIETANADLTSLRRLVYGASPISEMLLERAMRRLPGCGFVQAYGMTELSPCATTLSVSDHRSAELRRSVGRALPHSEIQIVDPEGLPVRPGVSGEVVCRGANVMKGYWRQPEQTAMALRDGWMHTGDWGYLDTNGYLFILDRVKDMIISGGENVYSVEVENALVRHPDVAACAVIGLPDETWGERVHAVVVPAQGRTPAYSELAAFLRQRMAAYKIPRTIETVSALPLSPAGKVLKRQLRNARAEHDGQSMTSNPAGADHTA